MVLAVAACYFVVVQCVPPGLAAGNIPLQ